MRPLKIPSTYINNAFRETERRGESIAAIFRLIIASAMLLSIWITVQATPASGPLIGVAIVYGLVSIIGLGLAIKRVYHPLMPFLFVFMDCAMVALALTMIAHMRGMSMSATLSLPLFSLAFVVLIHAALRYRPPLIAFGAIIFITCVVTLPYLIELENRGHMPDELMRHTGQSLSEESESRFVPLVFFALGAVILFYIVQRTKELAYLALLDGKRVAQLTRFFSPAVAANLIRHDQESGTYGGLQHVAVVFIDIRGFTRLAETISPEELTEFLSSFRRDVCGVIFQHGGTVDKFIGDAVLAVFGTPSTKPDDAKRAVDASLAVALSVREWFDKRTQAGLSAALVGIGAHYGEVFAGVIESGDILEHTIIGDTVNIAQRLERLSRDLRANVVISEALLKAANVEPELINLARLSGTKLVGHDTLITVFHDRLDS